MGGGGSAPPSRWHILSKADVSEYTRHRLLQADSRVFGFVRPGTQQEMNP